MFISTSAAFRRRTCSSIFLACQRSRTRRCSVATGLVRGCATLKKRSTLSGRCRCQRRQSGTFSARPRLLSGRAEGKKKPIELGSTRSKAGQEARVPFLCGAGQRAESGRLAATETGPHFLEYALALAGSLLAAPIPAIFSNSALF